MNMQDLYYKNAFQIWKYTSHVEKRLPISMLLFDLKLLTRVLE